MRNPWKFERGQLTISDGVFRALEELNQYFDRAFDYANRHMAGDWGEVDDEAWKRNDQAVVAGGRIASTYSLSDGTKIWVVTTADRTRTAVFLPDEHQEVFPEGST